MAAALNIPANGVGIGIAGHNGGGTFVWTDMAERYDGTVASNTVHSGADATGDGTSTRTADPSASTPASRALLLASWVAGPGALAHAVDAASSSANSGAYTFSNLQLGSPTPDRQIVVCIAGYDGIDTGDHVSAVTVGQQTGTLLARQASPVDSDHFSEMWVASVPEGESGTVEVTISVGIAGCSVVLYRLIGASTTAYDTATNADDPLTTTIDVPNNGCCIASAQYRSSALNLDWTGVDKDAEGTEETIYHYSTASKNFSAGETGRTVTAEGTSALDRRALVVVSWGRA